MTEPTTNPPPGWYVIFDADGKPFCLRRGEFGDGERYWDHPWPKSSLDNCTIGPSIADLLRDAARYRWLRNEYASEESPGLMFFPCAPPHPRAFEKITEEEFDALIDAELRARCGGRRPWLIPITRCRRDRRLFSGCFHIAHRIS